VLTLLVSTACGYFKLTVQWAWIIAEAFIGTNALFKRLMGVDVFVHPWAKLYRSVFVRYSLLIICCVHHASPFLFDHYTLICVYFIQLRAQLA
jgi:hypothetical protein